MEVTAHATDKDALEILLDSLPETEIQPVGIGCENLINFKILKKFLQHIFEMSFTARRRGFNVAGCHHLDIFESNSVVFMQNLGPFQGGILSDGPDNWPTFKTFFPLHFTREDVISSIIEAIRNISSVDGSDKRRWAVRGKCRGNIDMKIIVEKATGNLITAFPISDEVKTIQSLSKSYEVQHEKYFLNPCKGIGYTGDSVSMISDLFGPAIPVELKLVQLDTTSKEFYNLCQYQGIPLQPIFEFSLLTDDVINEFRRDFPSRIIYIISSIDTISLPLDTIEKVFVDSFMQRFPKHLSEEDVISKLKEAIHNYLDVVNENLKENVWEDCSEADEEEMQNSLSMRMCGIEKGDNIKTGTDWDYFGGPVMPAPSLRVTSQYAVDLMCRNMCHPGQVKSGNDIISLQINAPRIRLNENESALQLRLWSSGTCYMDTFELFVEIDCTNGEIKQVHFLG
jgi:hypothetical protein